MAAPLPFRGSIVALVTPFADGRIDEKTLQSFVDWQITQGTHGLVPCGTSGESPTLSHSEHERVVALTIEAAAGRVPVIAGAGSNSTAEAVSLSRAAEAAGADALLVVTPYYNKPTQAGLYEHFRTIHDACDLPILIYNIPPRSVIDMTVETMAALAKLPRIVGVKDATNDLARPLRMRLAAGPEFIQLSGEDATATGFLAQGGVGCISVTANVAPRLCAEMQDAWATGDIAGMVERRDRLGPLHRALFLESSPAPAKHACAHLGLMRADVRSPLIAVSEATAVELERSMRIAGVLN